MLFLVAVAAEGNRSDIPCAGSGEVVVPWFPNLGRSSFISIESWLFADFAFVRDIDIDPDFIAERMCEQFPGVPKSIHDKYVLETAVACRILPQDKRIRVAVGFDGGDMSLQTYDGDMSVKLWDKHPK